MSKKEPREYEEESSTGYVTTALGIGLVIAAVLVIITAGTPAAGIGFVIAAAACLGWGVPKLLQQRNALPAPANKERELLSAIRENGGSITPAEAAMETSLTVKEADKMLSELASAGHLMVERRGGALFYALPGRSDSQIEGG